MSLTAYLPQDEGLLPKWLLFVAVVSIANSLQAYTTLTYTRQIYSLQPSNVTPLSGRTFGTWTVMSGVLRLFAAYNITDWRFYVLGMLSYGVAWVHFMMEWQFYRTAAWGRSLAGPIVISTGSLLWMTLYWGEYVR